jgi:5'-deoxynucleotidase YfbR-like HD superfamily hydrolase
VTALRWQLLAAAWQHDVPEYETGDVPSHTKRAMGGMGALERSVLGEAGMHDMSDYLYAHEARWLKLADCLEGWAFCCEEMDMGNTMLQTPARRYMEYSDVVMRELRAADPTEEQHKAIKNFGYIVKYLTTKNLSKGIK